MERFLDVGRQIENAWHRENYSEEAFPEIAARVLEDARLDEITLHHVINWALTTTELPRQADPKSAFGQPPLTVYFGRRFHVDILFWVDGTTSIHQHPFSGAFHVLAGSSVHSEYAFQIAERLNASLKVGELARRSTTVLRAGTTCPIPRGDRFIHSLFHLERPTVTVIARTLFDADAQPQYEYFRSGLAIDPFVDDAWTVRVVEVVDLLRKLDDPRFDERVGDLIARSDPYTMFRVLTCARKRRDQGTIGRLLARVRERQPTLAKVFDATFAEKRREELIIGKRAVVHDAEHRFFLALLLNASNRLDILRLVGISIPNGDPIDSLIRWFRELSNVTVRLRFESEPWAPNLLGVPDITPDAEVAVRHMLAGRSAEHPAVLELKASPIFGPLFT